MDSENDLPYSWSTGPRENNSSLPSYSSYADGKGHIIGAFVEIDGKELFTTGGAFTIHLTQRTLDHSTFTICCRADEFDSRSDFPLSQSKYLLGKRISISFKQYDQITFHFNGLITKVGRRKEGQDTFLTLEGASPDILLEDGEQYNSFENQTLEELVKETCREYPSGLLALKLRPKYKDRIPYRVLYKETSYQFIQRLARLYGEWLYWNGEQMVFGGYGGRTHSLLDSEDMKDYQLEMRALPLPQNFSYQSYHSPSGESLQTDTGSLHKQNITNHFQAQAVRASQEMYPRPSQTFYNHSEIGSKELWEAVERQSLHRQDTLCIKACTYNPNLNIADIIQVEEYTPESSLFKDGTSPMESYLITEIEHYFEPGVGYHNTLTGIPKEQWIPPYYDDRAYPKAEKQRAVISDNADPKGIGRVRVRFDWMPSGQQTPWILMIFPYAGASKGFYFLPEIGEEVMIGFESGSMEKPYVEGARYNGNEKSGYYDSKNRLKVIHTLEGHIIKLDERPESMGITLQDKNNNRVHINTKDNTIELNAIKDINLNAGEKITMTAGTDIEIRAGKDLKATARNEIIQNSTGKTRIHSSHNIEMEARNTFEAYGGQKLITYTKGNAEMGALGRNHVHGGNTLVTAVSRADLKAPQVGELAESGEFKYTKEKEITEIFAMDEDFENEINFVPSKGNFHLLVHTRNYEEGEILTLQIEENIQDGEDDSIITLTGTVDKEGIARLEEQVALEEKEREKLPEPGQEEENENKVYKTYKGKDYTKAEWDKFEEKLWDNYQYKKNSKGFFDLF